MGEKQIQLGYGGGQRSSPAGRNPEPASNEKRVPAAAHFDAGGIAAIPQESGPDTGTLPRTPQNFTRKTSSFILPLQWRFPEHRIQFAAFRRDTEC